MQKPKNVYLWAMMKGKKGWKRMDPTTHKRVVSKDVVFDEISSYYGLQDACKWRINFSRK